MSNKLYGDGALEQSQPIAGKAGQAAERGGGDARAAGEFQMVLRALADKGLTQDGHLAVLANIELGQRQEELWSCRRSVGPFVDGQCIGVGNREESHE